MNRKEQMELKQARLDEIENEQAKRWVDAIDGPLLEARMTKAAMNACESHIHIMFTLIFIFMVNY
jgi:hypothetical protein